jgi:23S rRNA (adenine2503-C2)-methyltransferase
VIALTATTPGLLVSTFGIPIEDARKIVSASHRGIPLSAPDACIRRTSRAALEGHVHSPRLRVIERQSSAVDPFIKLLVEGADGASFETVRIPLEKLGRFSVCVSSQVGCALACAFCATGRMGLSRNLEVWEIVEQVREVRATLETGQRVSGVVFQGMGEPLANLDRVLEAIAVFSEPSALAIDARNITVCTAGLPSGIRRLAKEAPKVRLGLSLGSARREVRRRLMPIDKSHDFEEVIEAVAEHARSTGLSPMWAVTPLAGVNDTEADARALAELAKDFAARTGVRPRISVIPYNSIADAGSPESDPFARTSDEAETLFRDVLHGLSVPTHKRYSGGGDVAAACGQLALRGPDGKTLTRERRRADRFGL